MVSNKLAILGYATALSQFASAASSGSGLEVFPGFNVDMKYNKDTEMVDFTVVIPDNTWMGIVLGSSQMIDSDIITFVADGTSSQFIDNWSTGLN